MLRITTIDDAQAMTVQLEGRLAGPWVRELESCAQSAIANRGSRVVRVDLAGVTFVDAAGKLLLASMHARGAKLVAAGCLMRAVVAEITETPIRPGDCT